jgi:hypothetical protein
MRARVGQRIDKKTTPSYFSSIVWAVIALHVCVCIVALQKPE